MKNKTLTNILKGCAIGVAMIIPGVSGGTIAVLLNIYEDMINAIADLKKDFKKSFKYLLPIGIGMVLAFAAMYYPLKYALNYVPLQTITLFAGLMLGSVPSMFKDAKSNGFKYIDLIASVLSFVIVVGICFLPNMGNVDLTSKLNTLDYALLFIIGILGSCALVIPGISGSMLLLIFGYYQPILNTISGLKYDFSHSFVILMTFGLGIIFGFFTIAKVMKYLFNKFQRTTYWAIFGFVVGSLIAIYLSFDFSSIVLNSITIISSIIVGIIGCLVSYKLIKLSTKQKQ